MLFVVAFISLPLSCLIKTRMLKLRQFASDAIPNKIVGDVNVMKTSALKKKQLSKNWVYLFLEK